MPADTGAHCLEGWGRQRADLRVEVLDPTDGSTPPSRRRKCMPDNVQTDMYPLPGPGKDINIPIIPIPPTLEQKIVR